MTVNPLAVTEDDLYHAMLRPCAGAEVLAAMGMPRNVLLKDENGVLGLQCPTCNAKGDTVLVTVGTVFRDALSKKEWHIGQMCQACQDEMWPPKDQKVSKEEE
jgi:hypothetical protein